MFFKLSQVTFEEGEKKANEIAAFYIEVSAKTGENIKELYEKIIEILKTKDPLPPEGVSKEKNDKIPNPEPDE